MTAATAATDDGPPRTFGLRLIFLLVCAAVLGLLAAHRLDLHHVYAHPAYLYAVTALLAVGIYSSTSGIDLAELRRGYRTVILAITVGVLAKSVLIAIPMALLLHNPVFAVVLGVSVAQIDPLSVAALVGRSRMSDSAKTILRAWSSFDDPVTMLLTVYLLAFGPAAGGGHIVMPVGTGARSVGLLVSLGENLSFAGLVIAALWLVRRLRPAGTAYVWLVRLGTAGLLLVVGYLAVAYFMLFGLAIIGLFWRPAIQSVLDRMAFVALLLAAGALGLVFADGVAWWTGLVLGGSAYLAQVVVAPVVALGQNVTDRIYLALGQQNGITAITLALLLQPFYPNAVAIIGPAVLVVNLLHATANTVRDHALDVRVRRGTDLTVGVSPASTRIAAPPLGRANSGSPVSPLP